MGKITKLSDVDILIISFTYKLKTIRFIYFETDCFFGVKLFYSFIKLILPITTPSQINLIL